MKILTKILITSTINLTLFLLFSRMSIAAEPADSLKNDNYYTISLTNNLEITGKIVGQDSNHVIIKNNDGTFKILKQDILSFSLCDECKSGLLENYRINRGLTLPKYTLNLNGGILLFGSNLLSYDVGAGIAFYPNNYFSPRFSLNYRNFSNDFSSTNYYGLTVDFLMGKVNPKNSFIYYGIVKIENDIVKENHKHDYNYYGDYYYDHPAFWVGFIGVGGGIGMRLSKEASLFFECSTPILFFSGSGGGFMLGLGVVSLKAGFSYSF